MKVHCLSSISTLLSPEGLCHDTILQEAIDHTHSVKKYIFGDQI